MGNTLQTKASYEVDYSSVPSSAEMDSDEDVVSKVKSEHTVRFRRVPHKQPSQTRWCRWKTKVATGFILTGLVALGIVTVATRHNSKSNSMEDWAKTFTTEDEQSCLRLVDVDGDGLKDVLIGSRGPKLSLSSRENQTKNLEEEFCKKIESAPPCYGVLHAYRGFDGKHLWSLRTNGNVLFLNCVDFDVNEDGVTDCIASGRFGLLIAVDIRKGEILWSADSQAVHFRWIVYQVGPVQDMDNDGIPELIVANGGNIKYPSEDHNRESGRLIMLSGKTGRMFGERYLEIPHNRETYMSPIVYKTHDNSEYILFGSGGETVSGDLMVISLIDFYKFVTGRNPQQERIKIKGSYNQWSHYNISKDKETNIYTLYKGTAKGVMVPPVVLDVNKDGYLDILMTAFEGKMILYSGKDLSVIWQKDFPSMETYTSPAPGYFNNDDTLDFMIHWSKGKYPSYVNTKIFILNGINGSFLWTLDANQYTLPSDLTIRTAQPNRDLFLFRTVGRGSTVTKDENGNIRGIERLDSKPPSYFEKVNKYMKNCLSKKYIPSDHQRSHPETQISTGLSSIPDMNDTNSMRRLMKRHGEMEGASSRPSCDHSSAGMLKAVFWSKFFKCTDKADIRNELFIVDRTTADRPVRISSLGFEHFIYKLPKRESSLQSMVEYCAVLVNKDGSTAAVGDLDGDGQLDLIVKHDKIGFKFNEQLNNPEVVSFSTIVKIKLSTYLQDKGTRLKVNVTFTPPSRYTEKDLSDVKLLPPDKQVWTEYIGLLANSYYDLD